MEMNGNENERWKKVSKFRIFLKDSRWPGCVQAQDCYLSRKDFTRRAVKKGDFTENTHINNKIQDHRHNQEGYRVLLLLISLEEAR